MMVKITEVPYSSCNVQLLPLFLKYRYPGSQFCEVQGVRGAGQWDLGQGMAHGSRIHSANLRTG